MFESIGRVRDEDETRRRAVALGIACSAAAFVGVLILVLPQPVPPPVVPETPEVKLWPDEVELEDPDEEAPIFQKPAPAPEGGGTVEDSPEALPDDNSYAVRPLDSVVPIKVASQPPAGKGPGEGPGQGPGGQGTGQGPCTEGDCGIGGGGTTSIHQLDILGMVEPHYPATAKQMGLGDERCVADVAIDTRGRVTEVAVSQCSPVFHSAVEKALLRWRFAPVTTASGAPARTRTRIAVRFRRGSR